MTDTRPQGGFTLIEMLIVVVLVAILASVAIPSYRAHVLKANRSAAKSTLMEVAARQENFFADNKRYTKNATKLGYPTNPLYVDDQGQALASATGSTYVISLSQKTTYDFTATAQTQNAQTDDSDCQTLTINNVGTRASKNSGGTASDCW